MTKPHAIPTTATEAALMGWNIDRHVYPWVAYIGPRFAPDAIAEIDTPAHITKGDD